MNDPIQKHYDAQVYPAMSHPLADPALSGVAAILGGLSVQDPSAASILEIGCASGHHLIPLAMRWPGSRFVGIDLSPQAIRDAREMAVAAGVENVEFHAVDLREFKSVRNSYDFIMAHGFFSWVPDDVKTALLEFCGKSLTQDGIATISFNLETGWKPRFPVIQKVIAIQHAGAVDVMRALEILRSVTDADSSELAIIHDMMAKGPAILAFDDFSPVNDPWSLENFLTAISSVGLRWLGESNPNITEASAWQTFHSAVLCRDDAPLEERVTWERLQWIFLRLGGVPVGDDPVLKELYTCAPCGIAVADLAKRLPDLKKSDLGQRVLNGIRDGSMIPRIEAVDYDPEPPKRPKLNGFRMECARRSLPLVDIWHRPCSFPDRHREVLKAMDGTRDQTALEAIARSRCPELDFKPWLRHLASRGMFA